MRPTPWLLAEPYRIQADGYRSRYGDDFGCFRMPGNSCELLMIVSSAECGRQEFGLEWAWDHVSVSTPRRTPNWSEMCRVKDLFWSDDECVMQLHVPKADHLNLAAHCLHLWRPALVDIPRPPGAAVAVPGGIARNLKYLQELKASR
jgi:hypothetical protein